VVTGTVALSNGTVFLSNSASNGGRTLLIQSGTVTYELPTSGGRWLPNAWCRVYREDCPLVSCAPPTGCVHPDPDCLSRFPDCSGLADTDGTSPVVRGQQCTTKSFTQPCDWIANEDLLGKRIYRLLPGAEEDDFPYACAPGTCNSL
jgi:hypothetical protein